MTFEANIVIQPLRGDDSALAAVMEGVSGVLHGRHSVDGLCADMDAIARPGRARRGSAGVARPGRRGAGSPYPAPLVLDPAIIAICRTSSSHRRRVIRVSAAS
jgi:hypothetical protein